MRSNNKDSHRIQAVQCIYTYIYIVDFFGSHRIQAVYTFNDHLRKIGSMYGIYGIFAYIDHKNQPNVGKYTSPMDPMGTGRGH